LTVASIKAGFVFLVYVMFCFAGLTLYP